MAVSRKEEAYALLRKHILDGSLKPGDIINEHTYIEMIGCSRTPVREAIALLSEEGLVRIMPSRGMVVAPISVGDILMVYQARKLIEPQICQLLASQGSFQFSLSETEDGDEDSAFHCSLARLTGNKYIVEMERKLMTQCQRIRMLSNKEDSARKELAEKEHQGIVDAIQRHDGPLAQEQILHHLERTLHDYQTIFTSGVEIQLQEPSFKER